MWSPIGDRRTRLERLLSGIASPIALCQQTTDPAVAQDWMETMIAAGVEGVVIKDRRGSYPIRPGMRVRHKLKARAYLDLVVVGVVGDPAGPTALLLARPSATGMRPAGVTTALARTLARQIGRQLQLDPGAAPRRVGWPGNTSAALLTGVEPMVAEVGADAAVDDGVLRHGARLLRLRPDLAVEDLEGE